MVHLIAGEGKLVGHIEAWEDDALLASCEDRVAISIPSCSSELPYPSGDCSENQIHPP